MPNRRASSLWDSGSPVATDAARAALTAEAGSGAHVRATLGRLRYGGGQLWHAGRCRWDGGVRMTIISSS